MQMAKNEEKLNYAALSRELKQKGPERLYLLHGEEDYLLSSFIKELTAACLPEGADDFSYRELDGGSLTMQLLSDSVNALPFATDTRKLYKVEINFNNSLRNIEKWLAKV